MALLITLVIFYLVIGFVFFGFTDEESSIIFWPIIVIFAVEIILLEKLYNLGKRFRGRF